MGKLLVVLGLALGVVGCGSSSGSDAGPGGGGQLQTFSAWCIAGANAYCVRLYACEPASFPGTVAECEATPDNNCETKVCPGGTTYNSGNANTCVTSIQSHDCSDIEAGDLPTGCGIAPANTNICVPN
jgi:hypothetical protein